MSQNVPVFEWNPKRDRAALLVAADKLTNEEIAQQVGIDRRQLTRWKNVPAFQERVAEHVAAAREELRRQILTTGIADRVNRIQRLNADWERMQRVIEIRAAETERDAIGAETGLIVRSEKTTKFGVDIVFSVDTALLAELRATEQQAAKELGQWTDKVEQNGNLSLSLLGALTEAEIDARLNEGKG